MYCTKATLGTHRLRPARSLSIVTAMPRPSLAELLGRPLPDVTLPDPNGQPFPLRGRVGVGPLALFFYIRNGTPG